MTNDALDRALEAVRARGLDPESPGGAVALEYLLSASESGKAEDSPPPVRDVSARLAQWAGLQRDQILDVFEVTDDRIRVSVGSRRLPRSKADRQRALVVLQLAAERVGADQEFVSAREINDLAADYGVLDQNLPANVTGKDGWVARRGKRGAFNYRITQPGLERARSLLTELASGGASL